MRLLALSAAAVLAVSCSSSKPGSKLPPASPSNSRVTLRAGSVAADGATRASVTVTVRDAGGSVISGAPVALTYTGDGSVTPSSATTGANGTATFSVTSSTPTVGVVTATVDQTSVASAPKLTFHDCEYGAFTNGACAPPPFVLLPPAAPASWGGVKPMDFAVGDLDGNGLDDVVVVDGPGGALQVLVSTGDGRLVQRARYLAGSPKGAVVADVTGDAIADIVTVSNDPAGYWRLDVVPGTGDGTLGTPIGARLTRGFDLAAAVDLDGDQDLDLVARDIDGVAVLLNQGGGAFGPPARYVGTGSYIANSLAVADLDRDGKADVVGAYYAYDQVEVRRGNGDGTFGTATRYATGPSPQAVAVGDVDGDGDADVFTVNYGTTPDSYNPRSVSVLLGAGDGTLGAHAEYVAGLGPRSLTVADVDGDGLADAVTADTGSASLSVLRATGGGALGVPTRYESQGAPWSVHAALLDAGASADLVVLDYLSGTISTALGLGDGTFAAPRKAPFARYPDSVAAGDVTGDGLTDLVATTGLSQDVTVALGNGDGTFTGSFAVAVPGSPENGRLVVVGQLDGAGAADAVVLNKNTRELSVLLSSGSALILDATYPVTGRTEGVAIGDLDEDGLPDLVVASPEPLSAAGGIGVFLGTGGGALSAETVLGVGGDPWAVALGDVDGDKHLDVVLLAADLRVLRGDGTGALGAPAAFPKATLPGTPYGRNSVALADLDHDGDLDAVANDGSNFAQVFQNLGAGAFGAPTTYAVGAAPYGIALGDVNGDGNVDAVSADHDSQTLTLLAGLADGTFADGVTRSGFLYPSQPLVTDLNGDGRGDVIVADPGTGTLPVAMGSAAGLAGWTPVPLGDRPSDFAVADLDGDGALDLIAVAQERSGLSVAMGSGPGTWRRAVTQRIGGYPSSLVVADVNGDAKLDAVVGHIDPFDPAAPGPKFYGLGVLLGNGDGTFGVETIYQAGGDVLRVALGDVNGDGRLDAVVPGAASALLLLQGADGSFAAPAALPTAPSAAELAPPAAGLPSSDLPACVDVALADLDGDGKLDLIAANAAPFQTAGVPINEVAILLGNGDGTFRQRQARATLPPVRLLVGDLDADLDRDVLVATNTSRATLLAGDGLGGFAATDFGLAVGGWLVRSADLDLDGLPDLVTTNGFAALAAHRRTAQGGYESFTFGTVDQLRDLEIADLDGDGTPDVAALTTAGVFPLLTRTP